MTIRRFFRSSIAVGTLALAGCVGVPTAQQPVPGQVVLSQYCYAGFYQCILPQLGQVGTPCTCPGLGAPSYGVIR